MPTPATKRQKFTPSGVYWNAMTKVAMQYHTSDTVKTVLRPNRSAAWLRNKVPTKRPLNSAAMNDANPVKPNRETVVGVNILSANMPGPSLEWVWESGAG